MNIKQTSHELTKSETYKLTKSPAINRMREVEALTVGPWAQYDDISITSDGKQVEQTILSIMDMDTGAVYATNSATFQREFMDCVGIFGAQGWPLGVMHGKTKAGRDFITCVYVGD